MAMGVNRSACGEGIVRFFEAGDLVKISKHKYSPDMDFEHPHAIVTYANKRDNTIRVTWLDLEFQVGQEDDDYNADYFERLS